MAELDEDCREMLNRGSLFYQTVKDKLAHLAQVWDAAMDVKDVYDETAGIYPQDEEFMRGFLLCVLVLPDRANWGHDQSEIYRYQRGIASQGTLPRSILDEHLHPPHSGFPMAHAQAGQDSDVESFALIPVDGPVFVKEEADNGSCHFDEAYYAGHRGPECTDERSLSTLLETNCGKLDIPVDIPRIQFELSPEAYRKRALQYPETDDREPKVAKRS